MATFRVFKESGSFVTVHKNFIHDDKLTWKSKGILLYLLSRPDDWQVYENELEKHSADGRDSLKSGIKELEDKGYIARSRKRDEKGRLKEYDYAVFEQPNQNGLSNVGKPYVGKPYVGKPVPTNNDLTNNDFTNNDLTNKLSSNSTTSTAKEIIDYLNQKTNKHYKYQTNKTNRLINARLNEGNTVDDFKQVIDIKVAEWTGSDMEKYLRPETLFGTKFESYLNQQGYVELNSQDLDISSL